MRNLCYVSGAVWKTRTRIRSYSLSHGTLGETSEFIPRGKIILLISYVTTENFSEHIKFLWNEKMYKAFYIDSGADFFTNPNGINTKKKDS